MEEKEILSLEENENLGFEERNYCDEILAIIRSDAKPEEIKEELSKLEARLA